jgi:hypothetical protein
MGAPALPDHRPLVGRTACPTTVASRAEEPRRQDLAYLGYQGWVAQAAEQLHPTTVWHLVCEHLKRTLAGIRPPPAYRLLANHANAID